MSDSHDPPDPSPPRQAPPERLRPRREESQGVSQGKAPRRAASPRAGALQASDAEHQRRAMLERTRGRLVIAAGVFAALFAVVIVRVAWVTVIHPVEARVAQRKLPATAVTVLRPITEIAMPGQRAMVVDRTGKPLAISQPTRSVFADPSAIGDAEEAARKLKTVLPRLDMKRTVKRLSDQSKRFVYLERQITPDEEARINNLGIPSVDFRQTQQRHYPLGRVASHVIGGVDIDENGVAGVEKAFDKRIRDSGEPLRLSLDVRVQNVVREELLEAKDMFRAIGAAGIVMDVHTGEVLAMVSLPDYDANAYRTVTDDQRFNRTITGIYEPGSTFKLQTASMALELGTARIWDSFDAANPIQIGRFTINDFEGQHRVLTFPEVLTFSSNLGAARMARQVGSERQRAWMRSMGMFDRVGIELPEAARPMVHSAANWGDVVNLTVGFGHGISVSPMHVVAGTAAVANGGMRMRPTILALDPGVEGEGHRVMKPSTSDIMRRLMRLIVTNGFSKKADVPGFFPGGKTGTAEKNSGHGYKKHANVSAWMGVFPMQAPRYAVYIMLDEPKGNAATGGYSTAGQVSAPAGGKVITRIGPILGLMPDIKNMAAIEQALSIPLHPGRGLNLGPIRVPEPREDKPREDKPREDRAPPSVTRTPAVLPARIPPRAPSSPPLSDPPRRTQVQPGAAPVMAVSSASTVAPH